MLKRLLLFENTIITNEFTNSTIYNLPLRFVKQLKSLRFPTEIILRKPIGDITC